LGVDQLAKQAAVRGVVGRKRHGAFEQMAGSGAIARYVGKCGRYTQPIGIVAILRQAIEPRIGDVAVLAAAEALLQVPRGVLAAIVFMHRNQQ
jgi:hypothetical protein